MSFSENPVVAETSYQMLKVSSFEIGRRLNSFSKTNRISFSVEKLKSNEAFQGVYFFRVRVKL